jgi:predicted nucleotidyltransferase
MFVKLESLGQKIRNLRSQRGLPLRKVAAFLDIDQAILSKIEHGKRQATREQVEQLAEYFEVDREELVLAWLSDRLLGEIEGEELARDALKVAEEKIAYRTTSALGRSAVLAKLKTYFKQDGRIQRAWVFGSFARKAEQPGSDIDLLIEEKDADTFSYFDLADVQHQLEQLLHRKVDIGFASSLKEGIADEVQTEAKLIYENGR